MNQQDQDQQDRDETRHIGRLVLWSLVAVYGLGMGIALMPAKNPVSETWSFLWDNVTGRHCMCGPWAHPPGWMVAVGIFDDPMIHSVSAPTVIGTMTDF